MDQGQPCPAGDSGTELRPRIAPQPPPETGGYPARGTGTFGRSSNRRVQTRRACRLSADVFRLGEGVPNRCTLSDVSTGGCYVETPSPFSPHTVLDIVVRTQDLKLRVRGTVQVVHPGFGMGVQFSLNTADEREQVKQLIAARLRKTVWPDSEDSSRCTDSESPCRSEQVEESVWQDCHV